MKINRKVAPRRHPATALAPIASIQSTVAEILACYEVEGGTEDIVKIDFVFNAGMRYEQKPLVASVCLNTLREGTKTYTAKEIAETLDYYGAEISTQVTKDYAEVSLLCQSRHLETLIDVFVDVCLHPVFPSERVALYKKRSKSALAVNLDKVEFQCRLLFSELMFKNHCYRTGLSLENFDEVTEADALEFFNSRFKLHNAFCVISGKNTSRAKDKLEAALTKKPLSKFEKSEEHGCKDWSFKPSGKWRKKQDALQSAIRMGTAAVPRTHRDYPALYLANVTLGGYFGSRLMQNIREEKGYTYGINSTLNLHQHAVYLAISTQVAAKYTTQTVAEIKKELTKLCTELMPTHELDLIQYYIAGNFLKRFDGPFAVANQLKTLVKNQMDKNWYSHFIRDIFEVNAEDVLRVSREYLNPERFTIAVVGEFDE